MRWVGSQKVSQGAKYSKNFSKPKLCSCISDLEVTAVSLLTKWGPTKEHTNLLSHASKKRSPIWNAAIMIIRGTHMVQKLATLEKVFITQSCTLTFFSGDVAASVSLKSHLNNVHPSSDPPPAPSHDSTCLSRLLFVFRLVIASSLLQWLFYFLYFQSFNVDLGTIRDFIGQ